MVTQEGSLPRPPSTLSRVTCRGDCVSRRPWDGGLELRVPWVLRPVRAPCAPQVAHWLSVRRWVQGESASASYHYHLFICLFFSVYFYIFNVLFVSVT